MSEKVTGTALRGMGEVYRTPDGAAFPGEIDFRSPIQTVSDASLIARFGAALGLQEGWLSYTLQHVSTGIGFDSANQGWNALATSPLFADQYTAWIYGATVDLVATSALTEFVQINVRLTTGEPMGGGTDGGHTVFLGREAGIVNTSAVGGSLINLYKAPFPMPWHINQAVFSTMETDAAVGTITARIRFLMRLEAKGTPPAGRG